MAIIVEDFPRNCGHHRRSGDNIFNTCFKTKVSLLKGLRFEKNHNNSEINYKRCKTVYASFYKTKKLASAGTEAENM